MHAAAEGLREVRTILHKLRHAEDHDHRNQAHQDHRVLENAHNTEAASRLVEVLLRRRADINSQLALSRAEIRSLVAPFIAAESLPYMYDLSRSFALGVSDVDTVGREEVVAGVDC